MVHTSCGNLIIQVLEDHGKVILEVTFYFPQWKRNSDRGEPISSHLDLSLLTGFLTSHTSSPVDSILARATFFACSTTTIPPNQA